ncbi:MAG: PilZ domain-containing protein [Deltaproteobacteria bacterium]|nr:PilZ domain-containing protein [Deltaproteobacteria bacterium]
MSDKPTDPQSLTAEQRRRHPRARIDLVVSLKFASVQEFMDAQAQDISVGGMFLRNQQIGPGGQVREVGQLLALKFDAGNQRVVEGLARVVRVVLPEETGMVPGVGVEFLDLDDRSRALIEAIVDIKMTQPYEA